MTAAMRECLTKIFDIFQRGMELFPDVGWGFARTPGGKWQLWFERRPGEYDLVEHENLGIACMKLGQASLEWTGSDDEPKN